MTSPWHPERWHAATAQLDELLDLPAEERAARLQALRARDEALAADVLQLLNDHDAARAAGFLADDARAMPTATAATGVFAVGGTPPPLAPDSRFGPYRIVRVLGRGGMGIVYEAEEHDSGRRVALKVLQQRLADERERERFEREGRLAASIDHEHCVYVFGALEVRGTPAIAMEMMQGTLDDRLAAGGPLPAVAAVDAVLQLIAGLQAAGDAGILHRDVKPSNCFVDADGVVKIGDFGISRSLRPTDETGLSTHGRITGTPMYASPEQLRGAPLDVRADIYSLGATLYELATGRRPFDADDLMALLMAVANDTPTPPHELAPALPRGLSEVITRCLAKRPEGRFPSYEALAAALEPYSGRVPPPATWGRRVTAGTVDYLITNLLALPPTLPLLLVQPDAALGLSLLPGVAVTYLTMLLYYAGCESVWGRTPGKALAALAVVDTAGRPLRFRTAFLRAACFLGGGLLASVTYVAVLGSAPSAERAAWAVLASSGTGALVLATLFATARRSNGYAGLHELATASRVVSARPEPRAPSPARRQPPALIGARTGEARGAFAILDGDVDGWPGWHVGRDDRLQRLVWIRDVPIGTPPVASTRAALVRPTRLRWLGGRRTPGEAWDVFEGTAGVSLARACARRPPWRDARRWLLDLAEELAAEGPEDQPPLTLDRVWVLDNGRVKLLDDPAIDPARTTAGLSPAALLREVARIARGNAPEPWPPSATALVDRLEAPVTPPADDVLRDLVALSRGREAMTPRWRRMSLASLLVVPVCSVVLVLALGAMSALWFASIPADERTVFGALQRLHRADRGDAPLAAADRAAIETMLATRYRAVLADGRLYQPNRLLALSADHKATATAILRHYDGTEPAGSASRNAAWRAVEGGAGGVKVTGWPVLIGLLLVGSLTAVAVGSLVLAVSCRGVVFRMLGFDLVTADGQPAGRARVLARTATAWAPVLVPVGVATGLDGLAGGPAALAAIVAVALLVMAGGAAVAIARPSRGIQDRVAGTWIVPR
jgi:uncharacterized RDD family membrane protein YckC